MNTFLQRLTLLWVAMFSLSFAVAADAADQSPPSGNPDVAEPRGRGPAGSKRVILLGPDDKPAFADPPAGFDVKREGFLHGRLETVDHESKTVGTRRKLQVYTPPGYSVRRKYSVLYLLHGIGGDETEWQRFGLPDVILDSFAWIGAFSPAPNTKAPVKLVADPTAVATRLRLLWLSSGNKDSLIAISQGVHAYLKKENVPHIWHVDGNAHNTPEWRNNLYLFAQRIFRK